MAFIIPRDSLTPRTVAAHLPAGQKLIKAAAVSQLVQAQELLDNAHEQARIIMANAEQAFEDERQRGYADGRESALLDQAEKMIETVSRTVDYFANIENEMVDLVMSAIRKVIDGFDEREKVLLVVRNVLAVVRNQKHITLRMHQDEVAIVKDSINSILADYPSVGYLDIVPDARLAKGACILESEIGMIEASLEGQICALRNAFERTLGSRI